MFKISVATDCWSCASLRVSGHARELMVNARRVADTQRELHDALAAAR
jgi:hypothetical protein